MIVDFVLNGKVGPVGLGSPYGEVVNLWGEPRGFAERGPIYCIYGNLNLGFSRREKRLWTISIEPFLGKVELPASFDSLGEFTVPPFLELSNMVKYFGRGMQRKEPFVNGEFWWEISGSRALVRVDEDGLVDTILVETYGFDPYEN